CRIIGSVGRYSILKQYYSGLVKGLIGSSEYDPYAVKAFGPEEPSHRDGWGRATVFAGIRKVAVYMYKSLSPIFVDKPREDLPEPELIKFSDPIVADLLHARAGSKGMPANYFSVQPFEAQTRSGARLLLMHNGSVSKRDLARDLGSRVPEKVIERYSDSYLLTLKLAELIDDDIDASVIKELKKYVKTALNVGIAVIAEDKVTAAFGSYYSEKLPKEYWNYYRMYVAKVGEYSFIYASSTIVDFSEYKPKSVGSWEEIPNGTYYFVRIKLSREGDAEVSFEKHSI
ncbi:MAG: hypothetical protein J7L51_04515, partial [Desulfurococcales archaeon]|nr:hypothetical protein [Desulfurococcales archaeon]